MAENKEWKTIVVPYEWFEKVTRNGAAVYRITSGDLKGYVFFRPAQLMRKSYEKGNPGLALSYSVEQLLDDTGDVEAEMAEEITLKLSKRTNPKSEGKPSFEVIDEIEMPIEDLEEYV